MCKITVPHFRLKTWGTVIVIHLFWGWDQIKKREINQTLPDQQLFKIKSTKVVYCSFITIIIVETTNYIFNWFQDMRLTVYLYPSVIFVDKSLLGRTMIERDASEFGKRPSLINFVGNHISIRYHSYTTSAYFGRHSDPPTYHLFQHRYWRSAKNDPFFWTLEPTYLPSSFADVIYGWSLIDELMDLWLPPRSPPIQPWSTKMQQQIGK